MAENRGGDRPTAPQNNPANISATGGAGQSGTQPARYMSGLAYGQGQSQMQQQLGSPMAGDPVKTATAATVKLPTVLGLTEPTKYPNRKITENLDQPLQFPEIIPDQPSDSIQVIKVLYQQDPTNEDLRYLIESLPQVGQ